MEENNIKTVRPFKINRKIYRIMFTALAIGAIAVALYFLIPRPEVNQCFKEIEQAKARDMFNLYMELQNESEELYRGYALDTCQIDAMEQIFANSKSDACRLYFGIDPEIRDTVLNICGCTLKTNAYADNSSLVYYTKMNHAGLCPRFCDAYNPDADNLMIAPLDECPGDNQISKKEAETMIFEYYSLRKTSTGLIEAIAVSRTQHESMKQALNSTPGAIGVRCYMGYCGASSTEKLIVVAINRDKVENWDQVYCVDLGIAGFCPPICDEETGLMMQ